MAAKIAQMEGMDYLASTPRRVVTLVAGRPHLIPVFDAA